MDSNQSLGEIKGITFDEALEFVADLKSTIGEQAETFFGVLPNEGKLKGILGAVQQTFGNQYLYPSCFQQAAALFYFIIKDHPFIDGNKRIAVQLCVKYIKENGLFPESVDLDEFLENLAFLAIFTAESRDHNKDSLLKVLNEFLVLKLQLL